MIPYFDIVRIVKYLSTCMSSPIHNNTKENPLGCLIMSRLLLHSHAFSPMNLRGMSIGTSFHSLSPGITPLATRTPKILYPHSCHLDSNSPPFIQENIRLKLSYHSEC